MWDISLHKSHDTANAALRLYQTTLQEYRQFKEFRELKESNGEACNSSRQAPVGSPASLGSQSSKTLTQLHCSPRSDIGLAQDTRGASPRNLWQSPSRLVDAPPWHSPPPMQVPACYAPSPTSTGMQTGMQASTQAGTEQLGSERSPRPAYSQVRVHSPQVHCPEHWPSKPSSLLPMPPPMAGRSPPASSVIVPEPAKHQQHQQHQAARASPRGHFRVGPASDEAQDDKVKEGAWRFSPPRYSPGPHVDGGNNASEPAQAAAGAPGAHTTYPALQFPKMLLPGDGEGVRDKGRGGQEEVGIGTGAVVDGTVWAGSNSGRRGAAVSGDERRRVQLLDPGVLGVLGVLERGHVGASPRAHAYVPHAYVPHEHVPHEHVPHEHVSHVPHDHVKANAAAAASARRQDELAQYEREAREAGRKKTHAMAVEATQAPEAAEESQFEAITSPYLESPYQAPYHQAPRRPSLASHTLPASPASPAFAGAPAWRGGIADACDDVPRSVPLPAPVFQVCVAVCGLVCCVRGVCCVCCVLRGLPRVHSQWSRLS
jgi:hypothetical protein